MEPEQLFDGKDPKVVLAKVEEMIETFLKETGMDDNPVIQRMLDGETGAQAMGMTRDDLEVLYTLGFTLLSQGDVQKAHDVFFKLVTIDPLEAKNHYCMGIVKQMQGDFAVAAEQFIYFLAMDATNPEGYLRYGECQLALGERDKALEAFELAVAEAKAGNGDEITLAEAESKLAMLKKETVQ